MGGSFLFVVATVVIGFAEAIAAPEVAWSLADGGMRVLAFARTGSKAAIRSSRYVSVYDVTAPEQDAAAASQQVAEILRNCQPSSASGPVVLFPMDDMAVWLAERVSNLTACITAGPTGSRSQLALGKALQVEAARAAGLRVPRTCLVKSANEIESTAERFPLILKPADAVVIGETRLSKGRSWICANRLELERALRSWDERYPLLVQPYLTGIGEGVFGLATADGIGGWSAHRRLRMMNPHGSGSSACIAQTVPEELVEPIENLMRTIGWRGLFMVEMLRDQQGTLWFMELNGRPWGSMALARRQGFEYPFWAAQSALDSSWRLADPPPSQANLVCRNVGREALYPLFVIRGPKSSALAQWPTIWEAFRDVLQFNRSTAVNNWREDDWGVFLRDCWATVSQNLFKTRRQ